MKEQKPRGPQPTNKFAARVVVPYRYCVICRAYAHEFIESNGPHRRRDPESDFHVKMQSKIGECAVALYFRLWPEQVLNLKVLKTPDDGSDLRLPLGEGGRSVGLDVKTTIPPYKLIWPVEDNAKYAGKNFDILVSVSNDNVSDHTAYFQHCWIEGYVSKAE